MPYLRSKTCFFQALCIYRWMQVLQGRLCCSLKHLVNAGGFSHRTENYEINHVLSVEKTKPTNQNPHTPRKGVWANEFHCRHFLLWRLFFCCVLFGFYCPPGASVSRVLQNSCVFCKPSGLSPALLLMGGPVFTTQRVGSDGDVLHTKLCRQMVVDGI